MEMLSFTSKYETQIRELTIHVDSMSEQEARMTRTVSDVTETIANYETQVRDLVTALDAQERELETSRVEARHGKLMDQRLLRDVVLEIEIEREGSRDMVSEGRALLEKVHMMEDRMLQCQKHALHRAGESAVRAWLTSLVLDGHIEAFHKSGVSDLEMITRLDDRMLTSMRIPRGHRRKILAAAEALAHQLQMDSSILLPPVSMAELISSLYQWQDELAVAVSGTATTTKAPESSMSPARREAHRIALFGQRKGEDGLWRSPTPPRTTRPPSERSLKGQQVVQDSVIRMINLSSDM